MTNDTRQLAKPGKHISALIDVDTRECYPISADRVTTIGRAEENSICLKHDVFVSGKHAEVFTQNGEYWLRDLGSRNGTLINNEVVSDDVQLKRGDFVTIGRSRFEVQ